MLHYCCYRVNPHVYTSPSDIYVTEFSSEKRRYILRIPIWGLKRPFPSQKKEEKEEKEALKTSALRCVKKLLDHGLNPDNVFTSSNVNEERIPISPLILAVVTGNFELVKLLIDYGASPDQKEYWKTQLQLALEYDYLKIAEYLIKNGASIDYRSMLHVREKLIEPIIPQGEILLRKFGLDFEKEGPIPNLERILINYVNN